MNKIGICSDHAGYEVKELIKKQLTDRGLEVVDFGCPSAERCDYPDYAHPMGQAIESGELSRGISVCGSGNGISMVMISTPRYALPFAGMSSWPSWHASIMTPTSSPYQHASSAKSRQELSSRPSSTPTSKVVATKHVLRRFLFIISHHIIAEI